MKILKIWRIALICLIGVCTILAVTYGYMMIFCGSFWVNFIFFQYWKALIVINTFSLERLNKTIKIHKDFKLETSR